MKRGEKLFLLFQTRRRVKMRKFKKGKISIEL